LQQPATAPTLLKRPIYTDPGPLAGADEWLRFYESYWNEQLDALDRSFADDSANDDTRGDR
jgi:hypothetical protein